jgi:hypothetical protein
MGKIKPNSSSAIGFRRYFRLRPRIWAGMLFLLAMGVLAHFAWQRGLPIVARQTQYRLTANSILITPPPPWIRSDIKSQVLLNSALLDNISLLDDWGVVSRRVKEAFEFHPWVESVEQIVRRIPATLEIELKYRRPIAAVESSEGGRLTYLPVDQHAVRLPEEDLTDAQRRRLPRISGISGRPLVGDAWDDPRVVGGVKLIVALADVWQQLNLVEIVATPNQTQEDKQSYSFEIITSGGTHIVWGFAPGQPNSAGEASFEQKRQRLMEYAAQHGQLDTIEGPAVIDLRNELVVTPRTANAKRANDRR